MPNDWKYYAPTPGSLWTGPNAISHLCDPINADQVCTGWASRAVFEGTPPNSLAPIFNDIANCQLAAVNWVIPDGRWSDHAGTVPNNGNLGLGPAYVAAIVNAIGNDKTCEQGSGYWSDTVIFITWDDWGGWYDHVPPFNLVNDGISWGSGYVYGFRVPLLVVSGWTPQGYVSGGLPRGRTAATTHDFGSILRFIENNFALGPIVPPPNGYADTNAPDEPNSLADFFTNPTFRTFQPILLTGGYTGDDANYFANYTDGNGPADPDGDATESEN
jgi:hypothetical protein